MGLLVVVGVLSGESMGPLKIKLSLRKLRSAGFNIFSPYSTIIKFVLCKPKSLPVSVIANNKLKPKCFSIVPGFM